MTSTTEHTRDIADRTARALLDIKAVLFNADEPFTFTSNWLSPVYTDCRKVIAFPAERSQIINDSIALLRSRINLDEIDVIAGGETAGIPYAAWIADRLNLPMIYVRKKPKGFGRMAQIEGALAEDGGQNVLFVEDLTTDGASKAVFCDALRAAGANVSDIFSVFYYDIFPGSQKILDDTGVTLHALTTWWDVLRVARENDLFDEHSLNEVEKFLNDPVGWSEKRKAAQT